MENEQTKNSSAVSWWQVQSIASVDEMDTPKCSEYREPFLSGGSMAIEFTKQFPDVPVWVNDKYEYLYDFWITLQNYGDELSDVLQATKLEHPTEDLARELFNSAKEEIREADTFAKLCFFGFLTSVAIAG